jgi:hypothetical protein
MVAFFRPASRRSFSTLRMATCWWTSFLTASRPTRPSSSAMKVLEALRWRAGIGAAGDSGWVAAHWVGSLGRVGPPGVPGGGGLAGPVPAVTGGGRPPPPTSDPAPPAGRGSGTPATTELIDRLELSLDAPLVVQHQLGQIRYAVRVANAETGAVVVGETGVAGLPVRWLRRWGDWARRSAARGVRGWHRAGRIGPAGRRPGAHRARRSSGRRRRGRHSRPPGVSARRAGRRPRRHRRPLGACHWPAGRGGRQVAQQGGRRLAPLASPGCRLEEGHSRQRNRRRRGPRPGPSRGPRSGRIRRWRRQSSESFGAGLLRG